MTTTIDAMTLKLKERDICTVFCITNLAGIVGGIIINTDLIFIGRFFRFI